jgi:hypothetical protein
VIKIVSFVASALLLTTASAEDHGGSPSKIDYSPYAGKSYPTQVYFGDTHHHSANSGDAFMNSNRLGPADSYRLARGEEVVSSSGVPVKLSQPLDFLVISDRDEKIPALPVSYIDTNREDGLWAWMAE